MSDFDVLENLGRLTPNIFLRTYCRKGVMKLVRSSTAMQDECHGHSESTVVLSDLPNKAIRR